MERLEVTDHDLHGVAENAVAHWSTGDDLLTNIEKAANRTGLLQKFDDYAKGTYVKQALEMVGSKGAKKGLKYEMFFIGLQVHVGVPTLLGPGVDFVFFFSWCLKEKGCDDARPWTNKSRYVRKGTFKFCAGTMGGVEPPMRDLLPTKWGGRSDKLISNPTETIQDGFMGPPDIEIVPLLILGTGGYKYANGGMAEAGANGMTHIGELAGAIELSPYNFGDGPHMLVFEVGHPKVTHKISDWFRKPKHGHHNKTATESLNVAGVLVLGYVACSCPKDINGTDCPKPWEKHD